MMVTMWFEKPASRHLVDEGLLYPLRQTALRGNVQIQMSKLERLLQRHSEFLIVVHDGTSKAYYLPYSWLKRKVLPRGRVRKRPRNPSQQYLTIDQLRNQTHMFSFGLDRNGNPLRFDLSRFLNVVNSAAQLSSFLARHKPTFSEFSPKDGPFVLTRQEAESTYGVNWQALKKGKLPTLLETLRDRRFGWSIKGENQLVITHPDAEADVDDVVEAYTKLLKSGRISTTHITTEAEWRPYQRGLRDACLNIYGCRCAMCDVDIRSALTASHIRPASVDRANRANLQNVLLLCHLHDSLFDRHLITVRPDYKIACNPNLESSSRLIQDWVFGIEGQEILKPSRYPPNPIFLRWHSEKSGVRI